MDTKRQLDIDALGGLWSFGGFLFGDDDMIGLAKADRREAALIHRLQCESFMPMYERYHDDDTSPAKESVEGIAAKLESDDTDFYIISYENEPVGGVRVVREGVTGGLESCRISPIFILPQYQDKGIGSGVMEMLFERYSVQRWHLSTILQERRDCHFYEKHGFVRSGGEVCLKDGITLVFYEKTIRPIVE